IRSSRFTFSSYKEYQRAVQADGSLFRCGILIHKGGGMPQHVLQSIYSLASPPPFKNSEGKAFETLMQVLHTRVLKSITG
ncbi:MAG: hypothetical protein KAI06_11560, partial [Anaerolineales bacterium]|nr:hypothetical protein [Anaerolineales bacterium]